MHDSFEDSEFDEESLVFAADAPEPNGAVVSVLARP